MARIYVELAVLNDCLDLLGWSHAKLAEMADVDPKTVYRLYKDGRVGRRSYASLLQTVTAHLKLLGYEPPKSLKAGGQGNGLDLSGGATEDAHVVVEVGLSEIRFSIPGLDTSTVTPKFMERLKRRIEEEIGRDESPHQYEEGSLKVTYRVNPEEAELLRRAFENGRFADLGVDQVEIGDAVQHDGELNEVIATDQPTDATGAVNEDESGGAWAYKTNIKSIDKLIAELKSSDPQIRAAAAAEIVSRDSFDKWKRSLQGYKAAPYLVESLEDPYPRVVQNAAIALGKIGYLQEGAVNALHALLESDQSYVRFAAADALVQLCSHTNDVVNCLVSFIDIDEFSHGAIESIWVMGSSALAAVPKLLEMAGHHLEEIRDAAVHALGHIAFFSDDGFALLKEALKNNDADIRRGAIRALGQIGPECALASKDMKSLFKNDKSLEARIALARMGSNLVLPGILDALKKGDHGEQQEALRILKQHSKPRLLSPSIINQLLMHPISDVRVFACHTTRENNSVESSRKGLENLLFDEDAAVRTASAQALCASELTPESTLDQLRHFFHSTDPSVRLGAIKSLEERFAPTFAVSYLRDVIRVTSDPHSQHYLDTIDLKRGAVAALDRLEAAEELVPALHDSDVRMEVIDAIGKPRHWAEAALDPLLVMLNSNDADLQARAARAITKIGIHQDFIARRVAQLLFHDDEARETAAKTLREFARAVFKSIPQIFPMLTDDTYYSSSVDFMQLAHFHSHIEFVIRELTNRAAELPDDLLLRQVLNEIQEAGD